MRPASAGQAAASSRIENYLGFPSGLSGQELTQRAALQAMKFGAELSSPCRVVDLNTGGQYLSVVLSDGTVIESRAMLIATGVRYNTLPLERWADFEGAYLVARLRAHPLVQIRAQTEVTALSGESTLQRISLTDNTTGQVSEHPCCGLFCFIGARPATQWLPGLALDSAGFIRTDAQLDPGGLGATWTALGRAPLPFESSVPTVFAAGDVRLTSVKRVASAVGEGADAVRSIHTALGPHT
jgi:thioredoxin reductase (NADPH)